MIDQQAFWDARASLAEKAGTNDVGASSLERRVIQSHVVRSGMRILDVGCGTGETLASLEGERVGLDLSPEMVAVAQDKGLAAHVGGVLGTVLQAGLFDLVYTQRCLINLQTWALQRKAIDRLASYVAPGGWLLLVENSAVGLAALNAERIAWGLSVIHPPAHNRYLVDAEMFGVIPNGLTPEVHAFDFSSRYYQVSRIWNAWDAQQRGEEPRYDAPMNLVAAAMDEPSIGRMGQNRYWRWRRRT